MNILERELLLELLVKTQGKSVGKGPLRESLRITGESFDELLAGLIKEGLIEEEDGLIQVSTEQRLRLAVRAIREGADFERVGRVLGWLEFEEMVAYTFEENDYRVSRRFRFQAEGRRWEIDVLAARKPIVVCAECKHWSRGLGNMTARRVVEEHLDKVRVLSDSASRVAKRIKLRGWQRAVFVPVALSLQPARKKIYRRVPVVSVFELPSFLSEFEGQMDWLTNFPVELPPSKPKPTQTILRRRQGRTRK